jgi:hypothetical protein
MQQQTRAEKCRRSVRQRQPVWSVGVPCAPDDGGTERPAHHDGQLLLLGELHRLTGDLEPLELGDETGHEELEVQQSERHPGADPPPGAERYHLDLLRAGEVNVRALAAGQEPLRPEPQRVGPHRLVEPQRDEREVEGRAPRHAEAFDGRVVAAAAVVLDAGRGVRDREVARRVAAEPLQDHCAKVRHPRQVLLLDARAAGDLVDLGPEPCLDLRMRHEVGHDPLRLGRRVVGADGHELGAQAHHLALREVPAPVLGDPEVEQRVHVRVRAGVGVGASLRAARPYERGEELLLPAAEGQHLLPPAPEQEAGERGAHVEHLEAEHRLEELPLQRLHGRDDGVGGEALAEAHGDEDVEHSPVQEPLDDDGPAAGVARDAGDEPPQRAAAGGGEPAHARRVEHVAREVVTERAPDRAVGAGCDVALATGEEAEGEAGRRPVGEGGAALHQHAVRHDVVGDEDGRAGREQVEREDGPVAGPRGGEDPFDAEVRSAEEEERGDQRQQRRAGRERRRRSGGGERTEDGEEADDCDADGYGEGVVEQVFHGCR